MEGLEKLAVKSSSTRYSAGGQKVKEQRTDIYNVAVESVKEPLILQEVCFGLLSKLNKMGDEFHQGFIHLN